MQAEDADGHCSWAPAERVVRLMDVPSSLVVVEYSGLSPREKSGICMDPEHIKRECSRKVCVKLYSIKCIRPRYARLQAQRRAVSLVRVLP